VRRDGSQFWASVIITPLWDGAGKLRGFAKLTRDESDRRAAAEASELMARINEQDRIATSLADTMARRLFTIGLQLSGVLKLTTGTECTSASRRRSRKPTAPSANCAEQFSIPVGARPGSGGHPVAGPDGRFGARPGGGGIRPVCPGPAQLGEGSLTKQSRSGASLHERKGSARNEAKASSPTASPTHGPDAPAVLFALLEVVGAEGDHRTGQGSTQDRELGHPDQQVVAIEDEGTVKITGKAPTVTATRPMVTWAR